MDQIPGSYAAYSQRINCWFFITDHVFHLQYLVNFDSTQVCVRGAACRNPRAEKAEEQLVGEMIAGKQLVIIVFGMFPAFPGTENEVANSYSLLLVLHCRISVVESLRLPRVVLVN